MVRWKTILAGVALAIGVGLIVWFVPILQAQYFPPKVSSADVPTLINENRRTLAQIIGGFALLVGLYLTYRRIIATERTVEIAQEGQITERFTRAIDQLGATDDKGDKKLEVRLGGIYALESIARNSERDHWAIMDILAAYVRKHASKASESNQEKRVSYPDVMTEVEEEISWVPPIVGIPHPSPDIEAALRVLGRRTRYSQEVEEEHLIQLDSASLRGRRFTSLNLEGVSLAEADLSRAYFLGANFKSAHLWYANLERAYLSGANFADSILIGANLRGAHLDYANLEGAALHGARAEGANRPGAILESAYLQYANLNGADLQQVNLRDAHLHHTKLDGANLYEADLQDAHLQYADLRRVVGLTQEQVEKARGDETTQLPNHLHPPSTWYESTEH